MPSLRAYTAALTCSATATALAPIALAFAALDLGGSASDVGWVLAARTAPQVLLLLVGGVVADRIRRHLVVIAGCGVQAATFGAAGALLAIRTATLATLIILGCVNGIAAAFTYPAMSAMLPKLVSIRNLPRAASVTGIFTRGGAVLGLLAGGAAATGTPPGSGLMLAGATMLGAVLAIWPVGRALSTEDTVSRQGMVHQLADGWREFSAHTWLWLTVAGFGVVNMVMAGAWLTIGPVIAEDSIGRAAWGVVMGAFTAGLGLGNVVLLRFRPRYLLGLGIAGTAAAVPAVAALSAPRAWVLATLAVFAGAGLGLFSAAWRTTLGQRVPAERLSRVISIDGLGSFAAMPLGQLLVGPLAEATSPRKVALGGAALVALTVAAMLLPRKVRRLPNLSLDGPEQLQPAQTAVAGQPRSR